MKTKREKQEQALAWREKDLARLFERHRETTDMVRRLSMEKRIEVVKKEIVSLRKKLGKEPS